MAGDWIKMEVTTADKPEVAMMAHKLKCEPDLIVGKLFRIWVWANQNSVDGNAMTVTESFLDRIAHRKGFASAMRSTGWLSGTNGALCFPGFERHNGKTAKARAMGNRRVAKHRSGNDGVTLAPLQKALPEKRREDVIDKSITGEVHLKLPDVVALYPKRERQSEAVEALAAHVRKGADLDAVVAGTRAIAAIIQRMPGGHLNSYVPSAATFFRNRRWEDDPKTWLRNAGTKSNGAPVEELFRGGGRQATTIELKIP
jgi:hypothetical protein